MGTRWRPRGKIDREGEEDELAKSVVFLSSSEDEEANKDFTLDIIDRAKKRMKASVELGRALDLSASSSDEAEFATRGCGEAAGPPAAEEKKKRIRRGKKKARVKKKNNAEDEEAGVPSADALTKGDEPLGTADSEVTEVNEPSDIMVSRKSLPLDDTFDMEEEPIGTNDSVITDVNDVPDNVVLRKLLRGPRYFDPGDRSWGACYNCGEEGHRAMDCMLEKQPRPCFICGMFGHNAKSCMQGQDCFICKRRGHLAKDCPDKHERSSQGSKICLCCGCQGHEMSSCRNGYATDDLKEMQCYVCQKFGHLCCVDFMDNGPREVSCYNCAQSGHTGLGCAKPRGEISVDKTPTLCYKCGEEGHFARGCTKNTKFQRWMDNGLAPAQRFDVNGLSTPWRLSKENRDSLGSRSVPSYFEKMHKKKSLQNEGRRNMAYGKSRLKGGWIVDDPGDLPKSKARANGWSSPTSSSKKKYHSTSGGPHSSSSVKKHKSVLRTPSTHVSSDSYKPVFSASRIGYSRGRHGKSYL